MNPSSVSIVTSLSLVDITTPFMASSTETLSPLLNIFFFFILIILIFTWRFSTQLHHAKHKMAIDYGYIHFFQHLPAQRKQQVLQESSLE
jgi:hypothetical protein